MALDPTDLVHPDDRGGLLDLRGSIAVGEGVGGRCRVRHRDGTYLWLAARVRPLADADGAFSGRSISSWRSVHREVEAMARLKESEEHYRLLLENSTDGVALERDGILVWASPNLTGMLGWDPALWIGRPLMALVPGNQRDLLSRALEVSAQGHSQRLRFEVPGSDGHLHWLEVHTRPFHDARGERDGTSCTFRVVDAEVAAENELERRARYDQLTGLLNRNEVLERLDAVGGDLRRAGTEAAVLFCDVDGFKTVNDTHGHAIGDIVLRTVASRVRGTVREGDLVARIGGDELLVVLHHLHGVDEALAVADQVRRSVAEPVATARGPVGVTMSIGVAMVVPGDTADAVVARADSAMYRVKEAGRDGVQRLPLDL
jgi:diguanylate cyclase (GGDEF)-like protein/PAS domain S-box-containing protein